MSIAEYPKLEAFKTTVEQSKYLSKVKNKSQFIREAINEKINKDSK